MGRSIAHFRLVYRLSICCALRYLKVLYPPPVNELNYLRIEIHNIYLRNILQSVIKTYTKGIVTMAQLTLASTYKMLSGYEIPVLGFGVSRQNYQIRILI